MEVLKQVALDCVSIQCGLAKGKYKAGAYGCLQNSIFGVWLNLTDAALNQLVSLVISDSFQVNRIRHN
jgi:hypothetical protein